MFSNQRLDQDMIDHPWHVSVLIPARNEEQLLPRCLRSVLIAGSYLPASVTCHIIVVADSSTDRTRQSAVELLQSKGTVVTAQARSAGTARAVAAAFALARHYGPLDRCWLANTDADCIIPPSWLIDQLRLADQGIEGIAGTVRVDSFEEHGPEVAERFRATYTIEPDGSHPHVHGANLGVRADAYVRAGGWADLATAEDHDLWDRLRNTHCSTVSTSRVEVVTSGRRQGRAPHGFADALACHNRTVA
jgi:glycosyltransferase involved in cell wall biosynthesis